MCKFFNSAVLHKENLLKILQNVMKLVKVVDKKLFTINSLTS